jgi:hypothetical protein
MPFPGQAVKSAHLKAQVNISAFDRPTRPEDSVMLSSGAADGLQQVINMMKPFRNVIKRYWTDDEVRITHLLKLFPIG